FLADAWARIEGQLRAHHAPRFAHAGEMIAAISDPGKRIDAIPHHDQFRELFLNPPDIGGRYSVGTYVGLVPASLIGLDLDALLASASTMLAACREPDPELNPGVSLGLAIGTLAKNGRDKLTFLADGDIPSFGAWIEQLIAESTGKRGVGIVPVDLEPIGAIEKYGDDRVFIRIALSGSGCGRPRVFSRIALSGWGAGAPDADALPDAAAAAGHPVIRIEISDPIDLAA